MPVTGLLAMNRQIHAVMQRRSELLARIDSQRRQLAVIGMRLEPQLAWADRGVAVIRFLRSNPALVAGVIAALAMRRRGVAGVASVIWRLWKRYGNLAAIAKRLPLRFTNQ